MTFPLIKTSIIGGALLAFTWSFDEIIITYFVTGIYNTLPVFLYGMLRFGLSPRIYAISTIIMSISIAVVIPMGRVIGTEEQKYLTRIR